MINFDGAKAEHQKYDLALQGKAGNSEQNVK